MEESAMLFALPHAVLVLAPGGSISYANPAAELLAGRPLVGRPLLDLVDPQDRAEATRLLATPVPGTGSTRLRLAGGDQGWVAVSAAPGPDGCRVLSMTAVTDTQSQRRVQRSEQRYRAAFEAASQGSCLVDERGRLLTANSALAELLGRSRDDLEGVPVATLLEHPDVAGSEWSQPGPVPSRLRHADGSLVHTVVTTTQVEGDDGEQLFLVQVQDVTERRRSEQRLRHLALHDQLTDLPARNLLLERLRSALEQRTAAAPLVAALFVDLDEFKLINDALGHAVGDLVLREVARRLRQVTRPQDTVARLSGDEFVVVCPALLVEDEAVAIAGRLSEALRPPVTSAADEVLVSASIGVAFAGPGDDSAEELLHNADAAMYRAKQLGRRRYEVFDSALRERAAERGRVRDLLGRAIAQDRLVVHYQPVVDVGNRRVVALEALLRVSDDDGRLLLPEGFLELAAESGLLPSFDDVVLRLAAAATVDWSARYGAPLGLAVNLCPGQVDDGLADRVLATLTGTGLPPAQLLVEVTEQTLAAAGDEAARRLGQLRARGVRIALDDFGVGWASITYLRRLPVSMLKVDRSFVALLPDDPDGLVNAVVSLAAQLGLDATAEGVETEAQLAALRVVSTPYAQGWLFGPAVPAAEVPAVLESLGVYGGGQPWSTAS